MTRLHGSCHLRSRSDGAEAPDVGQVGDAVICFIESFSTADTHVVGGFAAVYMFVHLYYLHVCI